MYRQPRVPEMRQGDSLAVTVGNIVRFLRDFCSDAWTANKRRKSEIEALEKRIRALEGEE